MNNCDLEYINMMVRYRIWGYDFVEWLYVPCDNDFSWEVFTLECKGKCSLQLLDTVLYQLSEGHVRMLIIDVLHQFGDGLCVCLGLECETTLHLLEQTRNQTFSNRRRHRSYAFMIVKNWFVMWGNIYSLDFVKMTQGEKKEKKGWGGRWKVGGRWTELKVCLLGKEKIRYHFETSWHLNQRAELHHCGYYVIHATLGIWHQTHRTCILCRQHCAYESWSKTDAMFGVYVHDCGFRELWWHHFFTFITLWRKNLYPLYIIHSQITKGKGKLAKYEHDVQWYY